MVDECGSGRKAGVWTSLTMIMLFLAGSVAAIAATPAAVTESARQVPVAATVDVVVVGGGSAAVAAASAAAESGASVFLMAPRNYLGEDLAGTLRLWLEPGETPDTPLARKLFSNAGLVSAAAVPRSLKFTYKADQPADKRHPETKVPSILSDGRVGSAQYESVQYANDVTITTDLGQAQKVAEARLMLYQRAGDFCARSVAVAASTDGKSWKPVATLACAPDAEVLTVSAPLGAAVRQVRFTVKRAEKAQRLLLGEIILVPDEPAAPKPTPSAGIQGPWRPLHIKQTLDRALLASKVQFLYGCYATDVLRDAAGNLCGVVMANRAGRQAVQAKVIIDATEEAAVARMAGARLTTAPGPVAVKWVTVAGQARSASGLSVRKLDLPARVYDKKGGVVLNKPAAWYEYTMQLDPGTDWAGRAALEQKVRDLTHDPSQVFSPDLPFLVPPSSIQGKKSGHATTPINKLGLEVFQPTGVERLWVLGGCADVPRPTAEKLLRPVAYINTGVRVGKAAAAQAKSLAAPSGVKVARIGTTPAARLGEVKDPPAGLRGIPSALPIPQAEAPLPVLGSYDVVVIGGGTAGAPAGIGAARRGAKTLVVEFLSGLGGVGTLGMIDTYWYGNRVGFTSKIPQEPLEERMEWYRRELRQAGADIWFETLGCGVLLEGNKLTGVVVATPLGRGVVLAKAVIDGTGNADLASAAGAPTEFVEDDFALQNAHLPRREVGSWYINGNQPAIDPADPLNVRQVLLEKGAGAPDAFDWGQLIDARERRHVVGDYALDWLDIINERTFPDSIVRGASDYDSHGYQIHPYFMLRPARIPGDYKHTFRGYLPYRCLLPKGVEGLLVTGLGMSAHRDALPIVRMQPDLHNQGYAAGTAAAMAVQAGITPRQVDVKALQKHLVEIGNLDASVLTDRDSFPLPAAAVSAAITSVTQDFSGLEVLLAQPADALPALRQAHAQAEGRAKISYAEVLGVMGDPAGLPTLLSEAERLLKVKDVIAAGSDPNESANLGKMDFGAQARISMTNPDQLSRVIWALGNARDRRAVPTLCAIAADVDPSDFKLTRAVVVSLGRIGDPAAAPTLTRMLKQSPVKAGKGKKALKSAGPGLRELITATALYRCGDPDGAARRMLEEFRTSPNGPWAELAGQVLRTPPGKSRE